MNKYINFQNDLMKLYDKGKLFKNYRWGYYKDENIAITIDSYSVIIIPKETFYLDKELFLSNNYYTNMFNSFFEADNYYPAKISAIDGKTKNTLYELTAENGVKAWVDKKLLKYFNIPSIDFKVKSFRSLILLYEDNKLVGGVLPVIRRGE